MSLKVKRILVSHAERNDESSPYAKLIKEQGLEFVYRNFVGTQGISVSEFRKQNVNPLDFTAVIFTGNQPIDHFFRLCKDLRVEMPPETKYFCVGETTAKYLQKYITIRKRKLFVAKKAMSDLMELFAKHADSKFVYPCGDAPRPDLTDFLDKTKYTYKVAKVYETVSLPLADLEPGSFQMVCFFAPSAVQAWKDSFPNYQPDGQLIATYGKNTAEAAESAGLTPDIAAPTPEALSMANAIELYLLKAKKP